MNSKKSILACLTGTLLVLIAGMSAAGPLGTAFTYQGRLNDGGQPANGNYDLVFTLFDTNNGGIAVAGPLTNALVAVSDGQFTLMLDFGSNVFTGDARWLEIAVRTNGGGDFTTLSPRQPLTAAPYALYSQSAGTANNLAGTLPGSLLSGSYSNVLAFMNPSNTFVGNGSGLTDLDGAAIRSHTITSNQIDASLDAVYRSGGATPLFFNVKNFGAIPNDANPDSIPIQAAIDAAATNGGGVVFFPAGTYLLQMNPAVANPGGSTDQPCIGIYSNANITLLGEGGGAVLKTMLPVYTVMQIHLFWSSNIIIDGFTIDNSIGLSDAFLAQNCRNLIIRNCNIVGSGGEGLDLKADDLLIENCRAANCKEAGFALLGRRITVRNLYVTNCAWFAFDVDSAGISFVTSSDVLVDGVVCEENRVNLVIHAFAYGEGSTRAKIVNSAFRLGNAGGGRTNIWLVNTAEVQVSHNFFYAASASATNYAIHANLGTSRLLVSDNYCYALGLINADTASYLDVRGNYVDTYAGCPVQFGAISGDWQIANNNFYSATVPSIVLGGPAPNGRIYDNLIRGNVAGIVESGVCTNLYIANNYINVGTYKFPHAPQISLGGGSNAGWHQVLNNTLAGGSLMIGDKNCLVQGNAIAGYIGFSEGANSNTFRLNSYLYCTNVYGAHKWELNSVKGGLTDLPADGISGGLTTNIVVGGPITLCFTNGVLRAVQ